MMLFLPPRKIKCLSLHLSISSLNLLFLYSSFPSLSLGFKLFIYLGLLGTVWQTGQNIMVKSEGFYYKEEEVSEQEQHLDFVSTKTLTPNLFLVSSHEKRTQKINCFVEYKVYVVYALTDTSQC
jgi:hypothetical protein